jgi:hypothetical protein
MGFYIFDADKISHGWVKSPSAKNEILKLNPDLVAVSSDYSKYPVCLDGNSVVVDYAAKEFVVSNKIRAKRNDLLVDVDAIAGNALRWAALDTDTQAQWAKYRQELLDVPQQDLSLIHI